MSLTKTSKGAQITTLILVSLMTIAGCGEPRNASELATFQRNDNQKVVLIVMDLSGSFAEKMADGGKAYKFSIACVDRYFRRSDPLNDRIILAQISGTERSLLWEGSPLQLRKDFPSAASFREFLLRKADESGSLVDEGVANAINYVSTHPRFSNGHTRSVTLILSDMQDTSGDPDSQQRLNRALSVYGQQHGSIGIYFCDQLAVDKWKDRLGQSGIRNFIVESEIVGEPNLPNFE